MSAPPAHDSGVPPTLLITNDFPPRVGGIERYNAALVELLDDRVVVLTSSTRGRAGEEAATDAVFGRRGVHVVRMGPVLLPTAGVARRAVALLRSYGATRVVFGAAAPLGLLAPALRRAGAERIVACTHGHEVWWAALPGTRAALGRIAADADVVTVVAEATRARIAAALAAPDRAKLRLLPPPLDFRSPGPDGSDDTGDGRPVVLAVGRLVRRKGFDTLLRAWSSIDVPARLLIVGDGPDRRRLERLRRRLARPADVELLGRVSDPELQRLYAAASVFVLPCRTRGLEVEGFGYVIAEAQAAGLPVVVGASGGAPEALDDGRSGYVVDTAARDHGRADLARRVNELLTDPDLRAAMGAHGRRYVERFGYAAARRTLRDALAVGPDGPAAPTGRADSAEPLAPDGSATTTPRQALRRRDSAHGDASDRERLAPC